tara:strand:- start:7438 stop:8136 length:699 start_codon:yes stop_codon:yes gene_type:complete
LRCFSLVGFLFLTFNVCLAENEPVKQPGSATTIDFSRDIRPILSENCFHCHGPDTQHREGDLRLDIEEAAKASSIVPGHSDQSAFYARISSIDPDLQMPPPDSNKKLTPEQKDLLKRWINEGAGWTSHWAFLPPQKSAFPEVKNCQWVRNPIDRFVLAQLESQPLKPSAEASRRTLIRRLTFDLTGLPHFAPKAKRVIYLFMAGGPSHIDLFDYKPVLKEIHGKELPESVCK